MNCKVIRIQTQLPSGVRKSSDVFSHPEILNTLVKPKDISRSLNNNIFTTRSLWINPEYLLISVDRPWGISFIHQTLMSLSLIPPLPPLSFPPVSLSLLVLILGISCPPFPLSPLSFTAGIPGLSSMWLI